MTHRRPQVYTIPPDADFSSVLVDVILSGRLGAEGAGPPGPLELAGWTILVPTRRAQRTLIGAFGERSPMGASLLPAIRPLGDADEDDLQTRAVLAGLEDLHSEPAISGLRRQFVLAGMILDWARDHPQSELSRSVLASTGQALSLAESLGALIDSFDTDEVPLSALKDLFEDDLPLHREDLLAFLKILRADYPGYLSNHGLSGPMDRRSRLIRAHAEMLGANPPAAPVIAAGSTGSIPATAELLRVICRLPQGAVVLPGLDQHMDDASWQVLEPQHPQYGFKELLRRIGIERSDVKQLLPDAQARQNPDRCWLLSEVMRPSTTSDQWHRALAGNAERLDAATDGLAWLEAPEQHTEALAIALIMRRTLDDRGKTAALITPDRQLARKVKAQLRRWSIDVDDSAGEPALRTPQGAFLSLLLDAALSRFAPGALVALLDHPFALFGKSRNALAAAAANLEMAVLRGRLVPPGLDSLEHDARSSRTRVNNYSHRHVRYLADDDWTEIFELATRLQSALALVADVFASRSPCPLDEYVTAHLRTAEQITVNADTAMTPLWQGEAGEVLAGLFQSLREEARDCPPLMPADYAVLVRKLLAGAPVRQRYVRHPRLAIYGLLEARLVRADVTVLGGLNEGVWPSEAEIDPWLNRPQKTALALQSPERRLGLMAHDFVQAAAARTVWLTSSRKIDGQPAVASRWLLRLKALLKASGKLDRIEPRDNWLGWALGMDEPVGHTPVGPPRPKPPVAARPDRMSVTRIDRLIRDPYGIYAALVLGLEPLDPLEGELGNRERGTLVHTALERFIRKMPDSLPDDAPDRLMAEISSLFDDMVSDPAVYAFWRPRMQRMADWFIAREREWRTDLSRQLVEQKAALEFDVAGRPFTLSCIADRIDVRPDGTLRLIDYKTGSLPSLSEGAQGYSVQLFLEAYMAQAGAFGELGKRAVSEIAFVRLSGGEPPGELKQSGKDIAGHSEKAFAGLQALLADYADPDQAYLATDRRERETMSFDYDHLSRWREWGHLGRRAEQ